MDTMRTDSSVNRTESSIGNRTLGDEDRAASLIQGLQLMHLARKRTRTLRAEREMRLREVMKSKEAGRVGAFYGVSGVFQSPKGSSRSGFKLNLKRASASDAGAGRAASPVPSSAPSSEAAQPSTAGMFASRLGGRLSSLRISRTSSAASPASGGTPSPPKSPPRQVNPLRPLLPRVYCIPEQVRQAHPCSKELRIVLPSGDPVVGTIWQGKDDLRLLKVHPGSPADSAGASSLLGYSLVRLNGVGVSRVEDIRSVMASAEASPSSGGGEAVLCCTFSTFSRAHAAAVVQRFWRSAAAAAAAAQNASRGTSSLWGKQRASGIVSGLKERAASLSFPRIFRGGDKEKLQEGSGGGGAVSHTQQVGSAKAGASAFDDRAAFGEVAEEVGVEEDDDAVLL